MGWAARIEMLCGPVSATPTQPLNFNFSLSLYALPCGQEPLKGDGEVVKKSPAEIYAESEKEAMAFVLCVAVASLGLYMCTGLIVYG